MTAADRPPFPGGVIEVLNRGGHVIERRFIEPGDSIRIGRDYRNDLIVDDPFVSPVHAEIVLNAEGQLTVRDLGSENGLLDNPRRQRVDSLPLAPDSECLIGHSRIRYRRRDHTVAATRRTGRSWQAIESWRGQLAIGVVALLLVALHARFEVVHQGMASVIFGQLTFVAALVLGWAVVWSVLGRLAVHRFSYWTHVALGALGLCATGLVLEGLNLLSFAFGLDGALPLISDLALVALLAALVNLHLSYAIPVSVQARRIGVAVIALLFLGGSELAGLLRSNDFQPFPERPLTLSSPSLRMRETVPVADFFAETERLKARIDRAVTEKQQDKTASE